MKMTIKDLEEKNVYLKMFYYGRQLLFIEKPKKKGLAITKNKQTNKPQ